MFPEYNFDCKKARPNRSAPKIEKGSLVVMLDLDTAQIFKTLESVKKVLRALIEATGKSTRS